MESVMGNNFLSGFSIDFVLSLLHKEVIAEEMKSMIEIFSTQFHGIYCKDLSFDGFNNWNDVDLSKKECLVIPMLFHGHWVLVICCYAFFAASKTRG
jgi:Ulp1 family protease